MDEEVCAFLTSELWRREFIRVSSTSTYRLNNTVVRKGLL